MTIFISTSFAVPNSISIHCHFVCFNSFALLTPFAAHTIFFSLPSFLNISGFHIKNVIQQKLHDKNQVYERRLWYLRLVWLFSSFDQRCEWIRRSASNTHIPSIYGQQPNLVENQLCSGLFFSPHCKWVVCHHVSHTKTNGNKRKRTYLSRKRMGI